MNPAEGPAATTSATPAAGSGAGQSTSAGATTGDAGDVLRADPRLRRAAWVALAVAVALGAWGVHAFRRTMVELHVVAIEDPQAAIERLVDLAAGVFLGFGVVVAALGLHLLHAAWRAYRHAQMPPPGSRVLRDTPIVRGATARRRARTAMVLAAILALVGAVTPLVGAWVLPRLFAADDAGGAGPSPGP